jgi:hypothetical protein
LTINIAPKVNVWAKKVQPPKKVDEPAKKQSNPKKNEQTWQKKEEPSSVSSSPGPEKAFTKEQGGEVPLKDSKL